LGCHHGFPWKIEFKTNCQFMSFGIFMWTLCYPKHCYIEHYVITNIPRHYVKHIGLSCSFCEDVDFHVDPFKSKLALEYEEKKFTTFVWLYIIYCIHILYTNIAYRYCIQYLNLIYYTISYIPCIIQYSIVHLQIVQCNEK
jgi:hypothetical protein